MVTILYCPECGDILQCVGMPYQKPLYCKMCNKAYSYKVRYMKKPTPIDPYLIP